MDGACAHSSRQPIHSLTRPGVLRQEIHGPASRHRTVDCLADLPIAERGSSRPIPTAIKARARPRRRNVCVAPPGQHCPQSNPFELRLLEATGRPSVDYESDSLVARFAPNREALSVLRRNNGASLTTDADRSSFFIGLVIVDIFVGLADAISGPYIVLFLVDQAGFSPLSLSAILTARALSSIVFSMVFGAWIDRRTSMAPLLLALAGSVRRLRSARVHDQFFRPARDRRDPDRDWGRRLLPIDRSR